MIIYLIDSTKLKPYFASLINTLNEERKNKALRYKNEIDRLSSLASSLFIKKYVGLDNLKYNEYNKPYKDGIYFNLSHSNGICVFVKSSDFVGIDIEKIKPRDEKIIKYALNDEEIKLVKEDIDFYKIWTHKEAIGKRLGEGIIHVKELDSLNDDANYKYFYYKDFVICISYKSNIEVSLKEIDINELF